MSMNPPTLSSPLWSTAAFGHAADTSPMELNALERHLVECRTLKGRLFGARCAAEAMHGFVASRLVTTLVVATLLIGVSLSMP